MKNLISASLFACLFTACTAQNSNNSNSQFTINGTWQNGENGDVVVLIKQNQREMMILDSVVLNNHKFTLNTNEENMTILGIVGKHNNQMATMANPIFVINGRSVNVEMTDNPQIPSKITGEKSNEIFQKINSYEQNIFAQNQHFYAAVQDTTLDIVSRFFARQKCDSIAQVVANYYVDEIMNNMPEPICGFLFSSIANNIDEVQMNTIIEAMSKKMPNDPTYLAIVAQRNAEAEVEVGRSFKEIAMVNLEGNMQRLSEVVKNNKLTLLDFWASWCRPCLAEMPNVKKIYATYHSKGLEVYGVSLDENQLAWQNAINRLELSWIHVSDLKGWNSMGAQTYCVRGIPAMFLIDQNGIIVGKNLRGADLENKIKEILK